MSENIGLGLLIINKMAAKSTSAANESIYIYSQDRFLLLIASKYKQSFVNSSCLLAPAWVVMSNICTAGSRSAEGAKHRGCELNDNDQFRWTDPVFQKHNPSRWHPNHSRCRRQKWARRHSEHEKRLCPSAEEIPLSSATAGSTRQAAGCAASLH